MQNITSERDSRTAASTPAAVGILFLVVEDTDAAVHMLFFNVVVVIPQQLYQNLAADFSKVTGDDLIEICLLYTSPSPRDTR